MDSDETNFMMLLHGSALLVLLVGPAGGSSGLIGWSGSGAGWEDLAIIIVAVFLIPVGLVASEIGFGISLAYGGLLWAGTLWWLGFPGWAGLLAVLSVMVFFGSASRLGRQQPAAPAPESPVAAAWRRFRELGGLSDPWPKLQEIVVSQFPESLHVGMGTEGWLVTKRHSNLLVLGPSRSGKTSGLIVPQVLMAPGPVVAVTTKGSDVFEPTATTRARMGKLWHYDPAGGPPLPGCEQLRWSPLAGCEDWDTAARMATALVDAVPIYGQNDNTFFRLQSAEYLMMAMNGCALAGLDIEGLLDVIAGVEDPVDEMKRAIHINGGRLAKRNLKFVEKGTNPKTINDVRATAKNALAGFNTESGVRSALSPNFDLMAFCKGIDGKYDTIYITSPPEDQDLVQSLYVAFLSLMRKARFDLFEADRRAGFTERPPMYWGLDELASLAPIKRFPQIVSQSASTGLMITACLQSLTQAKRIWPDDQLLDIFRCVFIFPGIRDKETTETIAALGGKEWVEKVNRNYSETYGGSSTVNWEAGGWFRPERVTGGSDTESWSVTEGYTTSWHHIDRITPGDVSQGRVGANDFFFDKNYGIYLDGPTINTACVMPYWSWQGTPFREALFGSMHHVVENWNENFVGLPWPQVEWYEADKTFLNPRAWEDDKVVKQRRTGVIESEDSTESPEKLVIDQAPDPDGNASEPESSR